MPQHLANSFLGVTVHEGPFEPMESNRISDAIRVYGEVHLTLILLAFSHNKDRLTASEKKRPWILYSARLKLLVFGNTSVSQAVYLV